MARRWAAWGWHADSTGTAATAATSAAELRPGHASRTSSDHQARSDECSAAAKIVVARYPAAGAARTARAGLRSAALALTATGQAGRPCSAIYVCHSRGGNPGEIPFPGAQAVGYCCTHGAVAARGSPAAAQQPAPCGSCGGSCPICPLPPAAAVPPGCQLSRPCTVALPRTQCRRSLRCPRLLGSGHSRPGGQPQYPACSLHAYPLRKLYRTPGPPGTAKGWAATWPGLRTSLKPAATFRTQRGLGYMHDIVAWSRRRRRRKNGMFCGGHRPAGAARLVVCGYCLTHAFEMYSSSS